MVSVQPKTLVLITGANTGLGFEIAKALFDRASPYHILIGCRGDLSRASGAIDKLNDFFPETASTAEPIDIDISSDESISTAFRHVQKKFGYIDVVINNAGADLDVEVNSSRLTKREGWNQTWDVNVTGTHLFTEVFAPLLLSSKTGEPRLLFITSALSSLDEHSSGRSPRYALDPAGWPKPSTIYLAYRCSKTGMNMLATEWARVLHHDGVKVFNVSPGFLNTGLGDDRTTGQWRDKSSMGAIEPAIGGGFCADVVQGKRDKQAWPIEVLRRDTVQPW